MRFDILTLFPAMFVGPLSESILKRAQQADQLTVGIHNIRDWATDRHRTTDDTPYGGGAGMVMKAEPLAAAIRSVQALAEPAPVLLLSPDGRRFDQATARRLSRLPRLLLVCGHYEGLDERLRSSLIDEDLSIGDYVLTGGELAAMVVVDAVARLVPGVIDAESIADESHEGFLLEYPHYTRPAVWEAQEVPAVLRSGHHGQVDAWRRAQRLERTLQRRPDLLPLAFHAGTLSRSDLTLLAELGWTPPS
jgi:tRNA (guanine37-N1)-methyltransferase